MGAFMANWKGQKAAKLQSKGQIEEARKMYAEAVAGGMTDPRLLLAYSVLLIRAEAYQEAKDLLVKTQKAPALNAEQKQQLFMNYAVCCFKLGDIARGIDLLEKQHLRQPTCLIYETLGCLYVEAGEMARKAGNEEEAAAYLDKALKLNQEAIDYDEEDPIIQDNMAQTYYRLAGDKTKAKEYFDKAHKLKATQIDTLWFLSRYDVEAGNNAAALEKLNAALEGRFSPLNYANKQMIEDEIKRLSGK